MKKNNIVLIGMAGVGKSTTGKLLAENLKFEFIDEEDYIKNYEGKTTQGIIEEKGEDAMLEIEKQALYNIKLKNKVITPGGSIIYNSDLMDYLKKHSILIYLSDSFENIKEKLGDFENRGIIGLKNKSLKEIYKERKPLYDKYADITINCENKSKEEIIKEILISLKSK
jgi:shikimate kinase